MSFTLKELKLYLRAGQKRKIRDKLEDLTLNAISSQADQKGIKRATKDMEKLLDKLENE